MGLDFIGMIIQMLFALGTILLLILVTYRLTSKKVNVMNDQKYINVLERVQISKDTSICIIKIGNKGQVLSVSAGKTDIIKNLSEDEITEIESKKKEQLQRTQVAYKQAVHKGLVIINNIKSKFILKEDINEK